MVWKKINWNQIPWMTSILILLSVGIYTEPELSQQLIYSRQLVVSGDWWRVVTSVLVHYSVAHLFWNLLVLFVWGTLLELENRAIWVWLVTLVATSNCLLLFVPQIEFFAGLSGIVVAVVSLVCFIKISNARIKYPWIIVLLFLLSKTSYEIIVGYELFASGDFQVLPQAHIVGFCLAAVIFWVRIRKTGVYV